MQKSIIDIDLFDRRQLAYNLIILLFFFAGLIQPLVIARLFGEEYSSLSGFGVSHLVQSGIFAASFPVVAIIIQSVLSRLFPASEIIVTPRQWWHYISTSDRPVSTSVVRVIFSTGLFLVCVKYVYWIDIEGYLLDPELPNSLLHVAKLFDRVIPIDGVPSELLLASALIFFVSAALGVFPKAGFIGLFILAVLLNSWYETPREGWSHGEAPILMGSFPLLFTNLRGRFSLDNRYFGAPDTSPYLPIFFSQVFLALFYVGAFYAKMVFGGIQWALSDHLANSLTLVWHNPSSNLIEPFYIEYFKSVPLLTSVGAYGHLLLQFLPILALINVARPAHKAFETLIYSCGAILLWAMMGFIWPWYWWLGIAFVFIDFDRFARSVPQALDQPVELISTRTGFGLVPIAVLIYIVGFATQLPPRMAQAYPFFDDLSFYAIPYSAFPFDTDTPTLINKAGILRGDFRCTASSDCFESLRLVPVNKNAPVFSAMPLAQAHVRETFLSWCSRQYRSFCGIRSAASEGDWLATWAGVYKLDRTDGEHLTMEFFTGGATTVLTPSGGRISLISTIDEGRLLLDLKTSGGTNAEVEAVEGVAPDRRSIVSLGNYVSRPGGATVENFADMNICAVTLKVRIDSEIVFPFHVGSLFSCRRQ